MLLAALQHFAPALPLAVAYSGGADSSALLRACARRWPGNIAAIHVHHGLQHAADAFAAHCRQTCMQLGVPLQICHVNARAGRGQSSEDAARQSRYAALAAAARKNWPLAGGMQPLRSVALAQHADDQAETLLLALSRGAGVAGLAAMPAYWQRDGLHWHRPLLHVPGSALRRWLQAQSHGWIEDPTNADTHYTRNRIRAMVLPALQQALPQFRATFARSSRHCAQAAEMLADIAVADLATVGCPPHIALLQTLGHARQANVLRHWLRTAHGTTPASAQLAQLQAQIAACRTRGHHIHIKVGRGFVQRNVAVLHWQASL